MVQKYRWVVTIRCELYIRDIFIGWTLKVGSAPRKRPLQPTKVYSYELTNRQAGRTVSLTSVHLYIVQVFISLQYRICAIVCEMLHTESPLFLKN